LGVVKDDDGRIPPGRIDFTSTGKASMPLTSAVAHFRGAKADRAADKTRASIGGRWAKGGREGNAVFAGDKGTRVKP
jgi:hypothetical protein